MFGYLFGDLRNVYVPSGATAYNPPQVAKVDFNQLQQRVDSLELACAALWTLLKHTNGFTDEQLKEIIHQIDASDGQLDGKMTVPAAVCPVCKHKLLSKTATKCLWCGAPLHAGLFNQSDSGL
jgi:hypothetical protein